MNKHHVLLVDEHVDGKAVSQFYDAMKQDFVVSGALMPDAHAGYTLPIGSAILTQGVIVPSYVGYDIGCGMLACETSLKREQIEDHLDKIKADILDMIPVGFSHRKTPVKSDAIYYGKMFNEIYNDGGKLQLGTLGGGNHFIEIGYGSDSCVWIVIHSGSRNIGHKIATHYMSIASGTDKAKEGHYPLELESEHGRAYMSELDSCCIFALENRRSMLIDIIASITRTCDVRFTSRAIINKLHNFVVKPSFLKRGEAEGKLVHRKGATSANLSELGVIPGNLRDGTYVVRGLGSVDHLNSCSHGAGRVYSRAKAKELFTLDDFNKAMSGHEIVCNIGTNNIDESPMAYKDIASVVDMQVKARLIEVVQIIKPMLNIKG